MWCPYATLWIAYLFWRAFIFRAVAFYGRAGRLDVSSDISRILSSPVHEAAARAWDEIYNILMATLLAWARPFSPDLVALNSRSGIISWIIAAIVAATGYYMLRRLTNSPQPVPASETSDEKPPSFPEMGILLGIVGLVVAGLPLLISGQRAEFSTQSSFDDRITLPFMLASYLTLTSLLAFLGTTRRSKVLLASLMLFAFSVFQVHNASLYH
jgi:hypothetical protein